MLDPNLFPTPAPETEESIRIAERDAHNKLQAMVDAHKAVITDQPATEAWKRLRRIYIMRENAGIDSPDMTWNRENVRRELRLAADKL